MGVSILYTVIYNWGNFIKKSVRRASCFEVFSSYDFYINFLMFLLKNLKLHKLPWIFCHFSASVLISCHVIHWLRKVSAYFISEGTVCLRMFCSCLVTFPISGLVFRKSMGVITLMGTWSSCVWIPCEQEYQHYSCSGSNTCALLKRLFWSRTFVSYCWYLQFILLSVGVSVEVSVFCNSSSF